MGALLQDTHRSWADVEAVLQASCEMVLQLAISKDMAEMGMGGSCSQKDTWLHPHIINYVIQSIDYI